MARNLQQRGDVVTVAAPSGGVESGDAFLVGEQLVIALSDAAATALVECAIEGVYKDVPADNTAAFTNLAKLYWNDDDGNLVNGPDVGTGSGHPFVGIAIGAKAESAAVCSIKLIPS
jgi:predicted RecA/RadA family phage recombinase